MNGRDSPGNLTPSRSLEAELGVSCGGDTERTQDGMGHDAVRLDADGMSCPDDRRVDSTGMGRPGGCWVGGTY